MAAVATLAVAAVAIAGIGAVAGRAVAHARAARVADAAALAAVLVDPPESRDAALAVTDAHGVALDAFGWHDDARRVAVACVRVDGARACAAASRTLSSW